MTPFQKGIKYFAIALAFIIIGAGIIGAAYLIMTVGGVSISGSNQQSKVESIERLSEHFDTNNIKSIEYKGGVCDVTFESGKEFGITYDNSIGEISTEIDKNGKLKIYQKSTLKNVFHSDYGDGDMTITLPESFLAEKIDIHGGVGDIYIEGISTDKFILSLGTGDITGRLIETNEMKLNGGVGDVELNEVNIRAMTINGGVGDIDISGRIIGDCQIDGSVGDIELKLKDSIDFYDVEVDGGVGDVSINGLEVGDYEYNGKESNAEMDIDVGVGSIEIEFAD